MNNLSYLQKLSNQQFETIKLKDNVLITAIPGSGKTRTLTNKILFEYDDNCYQKTVAITYTKRASEEMEERIINQIGFIPNNIWIGTIHKFCLEFILKKYSGYSKYLSKPFTILGEEDDDKLKDYLMKKYKIPIQHDIDYTLSIDGTPNEREYYDYVFEYYNIQKKERKINFNMILYETYKILKENSNISRNISILIRYLCIDEYQDTQELQYQILSEIYIATKSFNLFIVGDPNQAIYAGIGGVTKNKEELEKIFQTNFVYRTLNECYRSNQEIINFYKHFAIENINMVSKNKFYKNPIIHIDKNIDKSNLIDEIAKIIKENLESGILEKEICIVAPQWTFLYNITNKLKNKLPDVNFDAPNIVPLKKDEESICYKLSKLLLSTYSFNTRNRFYHLMKEIKEQLLSEYNINLSLSHFELLQILFKSKVNEFVATDYLKKSMTNFFKELNIEKLFEKEVECFVTSTKDRIKLYENIGFEDSRLAFEKNLRSKNGIVISTIHGVKGDEFQVVIAFGLLNGYIPHWNSICKTHTAKEDSKKLLFVLCSRAKEKLYLFSETGRKTKSGKTYEMNKELANVFNIYENS